ncbi:MAG TPA: hypothetical protein VFF02_16840 [Anaeromyxobacteraceae bacterium]|nr:hypothetical protein [Anaeromyxobacteraceae bacterium]
MTINLSIVAALAVGALAIYLLGRRLRKLERGREVERRHREHLTPQVERLEDRGGSRAVETGFPSP